MSKEKVVLAYSGGLDTSVILKWLIKEFDYEVIAACCNAGQGEDFDAIEKKAIATGASKAVTIDIREEFITDYIYPTLKAGAIYEGDYLLGTSMARPLMAQKLVELAVEEGAFIICHGCTGKGNDQVRFETAIKAINPAMQIIAPWRTWDFQSREDLIEYAHQNNIPIEQTTEKIYSRDENIWHISHEGGELENPWNEHKKGIHVLSCEPEDAPDEPEYVTISFEKGEPVAIDGEKLGPIELLTKLNEMGSRNAVGTIDIIENRLVGMKSRGVYETPGGTILYQAHRDLEKLILDRDTMAYKAIVAQKFAELCYDGLWFTPLREAISAFVDKTQELMTGDVKMKLYKGTAWPVASRSPYSLYNEEFATFSADEVYDQSDAEGFINLWSLPLKIRAIQKQNLEGVPEAQKAKFDKKIIKGGDFKQ
ncbi:argininosuccinate synthase [Hornefia butyriciproducens]|jgi:argininosuccinate synthase|uniref:argininosuccinate synthase n=1 Tax=Hornefia butyriciproducens TaxID=2652293 RepID=UPI0023F496F6|nr:argininosuccinate synthase [Hornefia butyriciproducens]MCI7326533.1 argininosuccinate synthase [Clostridiales bacterium]MCI7680202.1 argininosuccinate synthase [Clostridiales bacterium]MDD6299119.1 argininosuccinate synthase [Hornefia butyriciproducens]MDD7019434.1 argininosuccinate synthase [Hornefia butyriciproducens]MDY2990988.1 argininosuccinate synthase [Hornefia butyriciproducens]